MGSESDDGWWESLFRGSDWSQAEAWDEQLGSDSEGQVSRQTGSPINYAIFDEETGESIMIALVCSCDNAVLSAGGNSFYCPHCDRACFPSNNKRCITCLEFSLNVEDRLKMLDEQDDEWED